MAAWRGACAVRRDEMACGKRGDKTTTSQNRMGGGNKQNDTLLQQTSRICRSFAIAAPRTIVNRHMISPNACARFHTAPTVPTSNEPTALSRLQRVPRVAPCGRRGARNMVLV
jgi:hypothetical protein